MRRGSVARRPGALRQQLGANRGANQLGATHALLEGGDKAAWRDGRRHGEAIEEEEIRRLHASLVKGHLLSAHGMKTLRKAAEEMCYDGDQLYTRCSFPNPNPNPDPNPNPRS